MSAVLASILNLSLTNNHDIEVETLAHTLAMPLVGKVGESDKARQFPANDILGVEGRCRCFFRSLCCDGLRSIIDGRLRRRLRRRSGRDCGLAVGNLRAR